MLALGAEADGRSGKSRDETGECGNDGAIAPTVNAPYRYLEENRSNSFGAQARVLGKAKS